MVSKRDVEFFMMMEVLQSDSLLFSYQTDKTQHVRNNIWFILGFIVGWEVDCN